MARFDPGSQDDPAAVDFAALQKIGRDLLVAIGQDPDAPGVADTPDRFARWWQEFIEYDPGKTDTLFETVHHSDLVIVSGIRVWSVCEHHLLPFWADIAIGYVPHGSVLGLSKFARVAHKHAHKPQLQERMVEDIHREIFELTHSNSIGVVARGEHLCMTMRGIKSEGRMTSATLTGKFNDAPFRAELFSAGKDGP